MKKTMATLLAVVMIAAVIGVAVVACSASTPTPACLLRPPTSIMMTSYPKQPVEVGQIFNITGTLTSCGTGLGNKVVFGEWQNKDGEWVPMGGYMTTNADGTFTGSMDVGGAGTSSNRCVFEGDAQYAPCASAVFVLTAS